MTETFITVFQKGNQLAAISNGMAKTPIGCHPTLAILSEKLQK